MIRLSVCGEPLNQAAEPVVLRVSHRTLTDEELLQVNATATAAEAMTRRDLFRAAVAVHGLLHFTREHEHAELMKRMKQSVPGPLLQVADECDLLKSLLEAMSGVCTPVVGRFTGRN